MNHVSGLSELIRLCQQNNRRAQEKLYVTYAPKLFAVCLRYMPSREEAEEVLNGSFVKIFDRLSSFKGQGSFEGWMRQITVRTCLDTLRLKRINWELEPDDYALESKGASTRGDTHNSEHLLHLVQGLPTGYKTVFNLYAIEGFTHPEIAQLCGISVGTSKSQLSKARKMLQSALKE